MFVTASSIARSFAGILFFLLADAWWHFSRFSAWISEIVAPVPENETYYFYDSEAVPAKFVTDYSRASFRYDVTERLFRKSLGPLSVLPSHINNSDNVGGHCRKLPWIACEMTTTSHPDPRDITPWIKTLRFEGTPPTVAYIFALYCIHHSEYIEKSTSIAVITGDGDALNLSSTDHISMV